MVPVPLTALEIAVVAAATWRALRYGSAMKSPAIHPDDAALGRKLLLASIAINALAAVLGFAPALMPKSVNLHLLLPIVLTVGFGMMFSAARIRAGKWAPASRRGKAV